MGSNTEQMTRLVMYENRLNNALNQIGTFDKQTVRDRVMILADCVNVPYRDTIIVLLQWFIEKPHRPSFFVLLLGLDFEQFVNDPEVINRMADFDRADWDIIIKMDPQAKDHPLVKMSLL